MLIIFAGSNCKTSNELFCWKHPDRAELFCHSWRSEKGLHGFCLNISVLKILKSVKSLSFKVLFEDAVFKMFRILCTGRAPPTLLGVVL